ncbi:MAG: CRISPR-associated protein Csx3 [Candidatus Methanoperedens sp.]|nr:CRISPR-associated protein Csx3 [Candidatus Methanoperedens sp.]
MRVIIDLKEIYGETAKLDEKSKYIDTLLKKAGKGNDIILTGQAPIWLYLIAMHALHGLAKKLIYDSPVTREVVIFDHNPF